MKIAKVKVPAYEQVALVLQGGGALGAYQAGIYEGLHQAGIRPNWITGISIGALNTAIIAGNAPEHRVKKLKEFWQTICQPNSAMMGWPYVEQSLFNTNDMMRQGLSYMNAMSSMFNGQEGFFKPRFPPPAVFTPDSPETAGYYDTSELKNTLLRCCDFDRINSGETRVSVGAVNIRTGNFVYFDSNKITLIPEHFMASGALPPAFPAIEIDGDYYWDGGLVSNTPLTYIMDTVPRQDTLVFQVDLWSARGHVPNNMNEVSDRIKEIQYSSRTRLVTDQFRQNQLMRHTISQLLDQLKPEDVKGHEALVTRANKLLCDKRFNIIQLIYRDRPFDLYHKDYQFGQGTMQSHWQIGLDDIAQTLSKPDILNMPDNSLGFISHDVHKDSLYVAKDEKE